MRPLFSFLLGAPIGLDSSLSGHRARNSEYKKQFVN
jgi:hypothetical protein